MSSVSGVVPYGGNRLNAGPFSLAEEGNVSDDMAGLSQIGQLFR